MMDKPQLVLLIVAFISYSLSLILSYLNTAGIEGLFYSTNGDLDRKYFQQVSPKGLVFGIVWPIIYIWNLAGIIYLIVSCCLPLYKSPVLTSPTLVPKLYLGAYSLAFLGTVGWLFAFDREILGLSLAMLIISTAGAYVAIGVSQKVVYDNSEKLKENSNAMLWLMRILIHNGLTTLATWLSIATLLNLADVIIYEDSFEITPAVLRGGISMVNGSTISLVILLAMVITWFVLENFVWEKYCRYTFSMYPVLVLGLSGLVDKLRFLDDAQQNLIIASVNLSVVLVAFVARIVLTVTRAIARNKTKPSSEKSDMAVLSKL